MIRRATSTNALTIAMRFDDAHVAQLAEHVLGKDEVTRSIRVVGSILNLLGREAPRMYLRDADRYLRVYSDKGVNVWRRRNMSDGSRM